LLFANCHLHSITHLPNYSITQWSAPRSSQDLKDLAETSQRVPHLGLFSSPVLSLSSMQSA
jgi:hypothetical protein